jgi:hypothetical protein
MYNSSLTSFANTSNSFEAMLEAFFCVQHNEHMKAWRWHQFTRNSNVDAIDAALREALKVHR